MSSEAVSYDPFDAAVMADPYPRYRELRARAPIFETSAGFLAVSRHEDVSFVLKNPALFSSSPMNFSATRADGRSGPTRAVLIAADPPVHTRLRNLVNRAFTPRRVAEMEPRIRQLVDGMLAPLLDRGEMDLVEDLAAPLPMYVIAEMLGVDPDRRSDFRRWSNDLVAIAGGMPSEAEVAQMEKSLPELHAYLEEVIAERRRSPRADLLSALVQASDEGHTLTARDVNGFATLLLVAGNETTTNLLGNAIMALVRYPEALARVQAHPEAIPALVEETLRWDSPVQAVFRLATQDVDLPGGKIPSGSLVLGLLGSANRDERRFPDPERFDIDRDASGHLAFGFGVHFCLGAPLARLEGRIVLEQMLPRLRDLRLNTEQVDHIRSFFLRGPRRLPIAFAR